MGPDDLDDLLASILAEGKKESALALYEGTREDDLVSEDIDERILRILGLDEVFDIDYGTYLTLLREKLVESRMVDKKLSTEESMLLTDEFKRVRGNVGRFKIKRKRITSENIGVTGPIRVSTEKFYLTSKAIIPQPPVAVGESSEDIRSIEGAIDNILKSLTDQNKLAKKKADEERKLDEQKRRIKREAELEKPIQKAVALVKKIIAPFQSILDRIMRFIQFTLLGYFVDKVLKWFADPANERKIKILGRFLKDWWPSLAFAAGLFLTPLGKFVRTTLTLLRTWVPQIAKFMLANPYVFPTAVATVGAAAKIKESERMKPLTQKSQEEIDKTLKSKESPWYQKLGASFAGQSLNAPGGPANPIGLTAPGGMYSGGGQVRRRSFFGGGVVDKIINVNDIAFNEGGGIDDDSGVRITGAGPDTQLIAAAPGEVVMSKKAVDKYGANFFLGLNKRAGGTNIPKMVNNIQLASGGGIINKVINSFQGGGIVQNTSNSFRGSNMVQNTSNSFRGSNMVQNTSNSFQGGGIIGALGRILPGTGRVMAPQGMNLGYQNKFLGMNIGGVKNLPLNQTYSPSAVKRYNTSPTAPSSLVKFGTGPLAERHVSIPKSSSSAIPPSSISRPPISNSPTGLNLNLKQNIQTIQGAAKRQEQMMRELGVKPSGYVNLRGQPINLGPQSRSTAPGTPVISSKTQMIVLPPTTSVAQKPATPTISGTQIPEFSIVANTGYRSMISDTLGIADLVG
jgi:hypothetical protein